MDPSVRRNITTVLRGIPAHRRNGSANGAAGLSKSRLALVERYMVEGEEAGPSVETTPPIAAGWAERAAQQRLQRIAERAEREAEERRREAERARREAGELVLRRAAAVATLEAAEGDDLPAALTARASATATERARAQEALAKAERRAAREAERAIAALEKKEARERKALARAAAKREGRERKALVRSMVRP
jgi:hypothetical protein